MNYQFNSNLIVLNLAYNRLSNVSIPCALPNLRLLDLSHNIISHISHIACCPALQEAYFSSNRLTTLLSFCPLRDLRLLDAERNYLSSLESVAGLAGNCKLMVMRMGRNPICKRIGYEMEIKRLIPWIQHFNPARIEDYSDYSHSNPLSKTSHEPLHSTVASSQAWGQLASVSSPQHFHTLIGSTALSTDRSFSNLTSRLTPQSTARSGFWSNIQSARTSTDAKEKSKAARVNVMNRSISGANGRKQSKVPLLLLEKVVFTKI